MTRISILEHNIVREGLRELRRRLPRGWSLSEAQRGNRPQIDAVAELRAPDERACHLVIEARARIEPRSVSTIAEALGSSAVSGVPVVMSRFLTQSVRERLEKESIGFVDLTGNVRLVLESPGLFIQAEGAARDPNREERPTRSLRGSKAGRLVRALVDFRRAPGVRELAGLTKVDPGYVSRVLALLESEALIARPTTRKNGQTGTTQGRSAPIAHVDWPALLRRWAADAPLAARGTLRTYLEPRGTSAFLARLAIGHERYAVTGSLAAAHFAPVAPSRLVAIWIDDAREAATRLGLRQTEAGANVMLIEPLDEGVFERTREVGGVVYAALSQIAADLATSPGRGPAEAEELISWMITNEEAWRD